MKRFPSRPRVVALAGLTLIAALAGMAFGQTPIGSVWWPSPWGAEDERGAANRITPAKVLEARDLIQKGKIYQLGRLYEQGMPLPGKRHFSLTIPGLPTYPPEGKNQIVSNDELVSAEIGQVGTQFDGLGHVGVHVGKDDVYYNGFKLAEFGTPYGLNKLGVEKVGVFFTRAVLLDVARTKGVRRLPPGYAITAADLAETLKRTGLKIHPGDVVLLRTGHGLLWMKDNKTYGDKEPGIGMEAARWLSDRKIVMIGADTWAIEVVPSEDPEVPYPVHQWDLTRHGIYHLENLDLEEMAKDKVYESAFMFAPLRLKGATGSPGNPIAVR